MQQRSRVPTAWRQSSSSGCARGHQGPGSAKHVARKGGRGQGCQVASLGSKVWRTTSTGLPRTFGAR
eukprot:8841790-Alexandrium_andersonii.AAC.1